MHTDRLTALIAFHTQGRAESIVATVLANRVNPAPVVCSHPFGHIRNNGDMVCGACHTIVETTSPTTQADHR